MKTDIQITTQFIKLDSFLKLSGACETGADAKEFILASKVLVNGQVELRRGRKLFENDVVSFKNFTLTVVK